MRPAFLVLALVLTLALSAVFANCGTFKFTNNFKEVLRVSPSNPKETFCNRPVPSVINPGQTVDFPIEESRQGYFVNIKTNDDSVDYTLSLQYSQLAGLSQYNFQDEINTGPFSWSYNKQSLSFCTERQFKEAAGTCSLFKAD